MDAEPLKKPLKLSDIEEAIKQISGKPKRRYTQQEIDEARGNLILLNDRVFFVTFSDNKNNPIITDIVNALRKIHDVIPIPPLERTILQNASLMMYWVAV